MKTVAFQRLGFSVRFQNCQLKKIRYFIHFPHILRLDGHLTYSVISGELVEMKMETRLDGAAEHFVHLVGIYPIGSGYLETRYV